MRFFRFELLALAALLIAAPMHAAQKSLGDMGGQPLSSKLSEYIDARFGVRAPFGGAEIFVNAKSGGEPSRLAKSVSGADGHPALPESGALLLLGSGLCALATLLRWRRAGDA